jgi:hypothetical protein
LPKNLFFSCLSSLFKVYCVAAVFITKLSVAGAAHNFANVVQKHITSSRRLNNAKQFALFLTPLAVSKLKKPSSWLFNKVSGAGAAHNSSGFDPKKAKQLAFS